MTAQQGPRIEQDTTLGFVGLWIARDSHGLIQDRKGYVLRAGSEADMRAALAELAAPEIKEPKAAKPKAVISPETADSFKDGQT